MSIQGDIDAFMAEVAKDPDKYLEPEGNDYIRQRLAYEKKMAEWLENPPMTEKRISPTRSVILIDKRTMPTFDYEQGKEEVLNESTVE